MLTHRASSLFNHQESRVRMSLKSLHLPLPLLLLVCSSSSRIRTLAAMSSEGRGSFSYTRLKADGSPKVSYLYTGGSSWFAGWREN